MFARWPYLYSPSETVTVFETHFRRNITYKNTRETQQGEGRLCISVFVREKCVYTVCVWELLSMAPRCSDLPITRSIKLLIPKIQASNSTTEEQEKNLPGWGKKTLRLFLGGWQLKLCTNTVFRRAWAGVMCFTASSIRRDYWPPVNTLRAKQTFYLDITKAGTFCFSSKFN